MSCVLRATGNNFQVESFLADSSFSPCNVFRKGERKSEQHVWDTSGLTVDVSEPASNDLSQQIQDALSFLKDNKDELIRLRNYNGLETISLDFGIDRKNGFLHASFFPPRLITVAGELGLGIELSIYGED